MRIQNLFTIIALVALAALVGLVVRSLLAPGPDTSVQNVQRQAPSRSELPQIWVARETLEVGAFVDASSFEPRDWPSQAVLTEHLRVQEVAGDQLAGSVARERIIAGEPILMKKLVKPGERGFLSAVLLPGMRAATVPVTQVGAHSGLLLPGDRVDVILTQTLGGGDSGERAYVGETIIRAVRVLAVGLDLSAPEESGRVDDDPRTVTLEVTPRQAEQISVSLALGSLSMAVRSLPSTESDALEDELATTAADLSKPEGPTWGDDVSSALSRGGGTGVVIMRGSSAATTR